MSVVVPLRNGLPFFDVQAQLDGVTYTLELRWNVRATAWFLNVLDEAEQNVFLAGLKLVANFPLAAYVTGRSPPGALVCVDTSGQGADPGLNDLGARHQLLYYSKAELGL